MSTKKEITISSLLKRLGDEGITVSLNELAPLLDNLGLNEVSLSSALDERTVKKLGKYYGVDFLKKPLAKKPLVMPVILPKKKEEPVAPKVEPISPAPSPSLKEEIPEKRFTLSGRVVARIMAMMLLVQEDLRGERVDEEDFAKIFVANVEKPYPTSYDFYREIVSGVHAHYREINTIVAFNLKNYTFDRLSSVDRAIVRIAVWEMAFNKMDKRVVIDTALNITREYSDIDGKQVPFNNSLLDAISRYLEQGSHV